MNINFTKLTKPTASLVNTLNRWGNDPNLTPMTRHSRNKSELEEERILTLEGLHQRLEHECLYLIHLDNRLIGEMSYMVDPSHLYKKESGTAWISITIGESEGRGKGVGYTALQYLERQIEEQGLKRIELGVFEFNKAAQKLYRKLGYKEIAHIKDFTYYQEEMWSDIRMEKYVYDHT